MTNRIVLTAVRPPRIDDDYTPGPTAIAFSRLRMAAEISILEASRHMSMSPTQIFDMERGRTRPNSWESAFTKLGDAIDPEVRDERECQQCISIRGEWFEAIKSQGATKPVDLVLWYAEDHQAGTGHKALCPLAYHSTCPFVTMGFLCSKKRF